MNKRILIVDDDEDILLMLRFTLKKLGPEYEIVTALGSVEALEQIEAQWFDLVVTDYMMKAITGVDLARAVRRISPKTQVVLMTAYGTKRLRDTTEFLGFDGYLDKPFTLQRIRNIVKNTIEVVDKGTDPADTAASTLYQAIRKQVQTLQINTNAQSVLLLSSDGYPVFIAGQTDNLRVSNISALIAGNFMGASELANLLGNQSAFKSSFHEGDNYNIYVYDVDGTFLLAVVFDAKRKPGVAWFYTKQTAAAIISLLEQSPEIQLVKEES